ncbi:MHS family MFS transporter [Microbacterium trichothecenolyticum]|uniref:MHS family MFS transporter n=1 Tax=Microbacterium ureisolvens TaxID=2781186 RepID=A0ABS7I2K6_9MICO|nr:MULTISPECIES: MFS transporter [Microbacterium]MBW9111897.1 MHS family MFS transporter [Microbacterium ureisolvens]MBW9122256.1 MHS family MFS transporter [Microbacterium trichothecenolyticum]
MTETQTREKSTRKIALASLIGTTIEWYDLFIYTTAAAVAFNFLFFPEFDPIVGTLAAFATYATAYIARPVGAIIFGHIGDRAGRKKTLTITLTIMGVATFLIGLLPTYAAIGIAAPILLVTLRFFQGLGLGGEWGGAVLLAVEHAPAHRRGFFGSWVQMGVPAGVILSNLVWLGIVLLPEEELLAWGWRIPFLLSVVLIFVGLWIRSKVEETPTFENVANEDEKAKIPFFELVRDYWGQILLIAGSYFATGVVFTVLIAFALNYATTALALPRAEVLTAIIIASVLNFFLLPLFGAVSDRLGRKATYLSGLVGMAILAFPFFWLLNLAQFWSVILGFVLMVIPFSAAYGPQATLFAEVFRGNIRYSGLSVGYQLGAILGSALTPLVTTTLFAVTGEVSVVAWYMIGTCAISFVCTVVLRSRHWGADALQAPTDLTASVYTQRPRTGRAAR